MQNELNIEKEIKTKSDKASKINLTNEVLTQATMPLG